MKILVDLLKEVWGSSRTIGDERTWHARSGGDFGAETTWWVVTPERKRYGPFKTDAAAKLFLANRKDLPRGSQVKPADKNGAM